MLLIALAVIGLFGGLAIFITRQQYQATIYLVNPREVSCPPDFKSTGGGRFERCVAINLHPNHWSRRMNTPGDFEVPFTPHVQARGCNDEIYALDRPGEKFNTSCGYLEYRSVDGQAREVLEGINPQQPVKTQAATPHTASRNTVMEIHRATYGSPERNRVCDATSRVTALCRKTQLCMLKPDNSFCGDPIYGSVKSMTVTYECSGRTINASGAEGEIMMLSCQ